MKRIFVAVLGIVAVLSYSPAVFAIPATFTVEGVLTVANNSLPAVGDTIRIDIDLENGGAASIRRYLIFLTSKVSA